MVEKERESERERERERSIPESTQKSGPQAESLRMKYSHDEIHTEAVETGECLFFERDFKTEREWKQRVWCGRKEEGEVEEEEEQRRRRKSRRRRSGWLQ